MSEEQQVDYLELAKAYAEAIAQADSPSKRHQAREATIAFALVDIAESLRYLACAFEDVSVKGR